MAERKSKNWILFFAVLFALCIGAFLLLKQGGNVGTIAVIRVDGEIYEKINLDTVAVAYDIEIKTDYGYNKIHVEQGSISVCEADCPDQICVNQGSISTDAVPIICMPHRVTVEIEGDDVDG